MPKPEDRLEDRRAEARIALAAEPAVRAAERALVTGSARVLAETLAVAAAAEARRRLESVLELKARADADPARRDAYGLAADDLRRWAAEVYLAVLRGTGEGRSLRLDESATDRVAGQLDPVAHAELVEDVLPVPLDRLDADEELLRDLLRGIRLGDQLQHL